jgi:esterase/lipase
MKGHQRKTPLLFLYGVTLLLACISFSSQAQVVSHFIESVGVKAEADYHKGQIDKPAILIVHGFLTTNKFHTVIAMAKALQDEGYTTLTPTLTLDISKRKNSIKCNSLHTHTLEKDVLEIKDWNDWLVSQGHKKVIMIGHSSGSQEMLEFLNTQNTSNIIGTVFTSLFYLNGKELGTLQNELDYARDLLLKKQNRPHKYSFLFCKNNYYATPSSYLSYMKLDRNYVLDSMKKLKMPNYTIMGSADKRYLSVGENWITELKESGTELIMVEGANHFFSSEHEFDLQDHLVFIVNKLAQ